MGNHTFLGRNVCDFHDEHCGPEEYQMLAPKQDTLRGGECDDVAHFTYWIWKFNIFSATRAGTNQADINLKLFESFREGWVPTVKTFICVFISIMLSILTKMV